MYSDTQKALRSEFWHLLQDIDDKEFLVATTLVDSFWLVIAYVMVWNGHRSFSQKPIFVKTMVYSLRPEIFTLIFL